MTLDNLYSDYDNLDTRDSALKAYNIVEKTADLVISLSNYEGDKVLSEDEFNKFGKAIYGTTLKDQWQSGATVSELLTSLDSTIDEALSVIGYEGEDLSELYTFYEDTNRMPFLYSNAEGATQQDNARLRVQDLQDYIKTKKNNLKTTLENAEDGFDLFGEQMYSDDYMLGDIFSSYNDEGYDEFSEGLKNIYTKQDYVRGAGRSSIPITVLKDEVSDSRSSGDDKDFSGNYGAWSMNYRLNEEALTDLNLLFDEFNIDSIIPTQQDLETLAEHAYTYIGNYETGSNKSEAIMKNLNTYLQNVELARNEMSNFESIQLTLKNQNKLALGQ